MNKIVSGLCLAMALSANPASAGQVPTGIPPLDHVFLVVMENHGYDEIFNNPNAPYVNAFAAHANFATNYFAVAHPSLTNYLEIVGGSNFGVLTDDAPDWHNSACQTNLATGVAQTDNPVTGPVCPIAGQGKDAPTVAIDTTNEAGPPGLNNIDGQRSIAANPNTLGQTIADQLVAKGLSWKSYQESLPLVGADRVNYSDGVFTDSTDFTQILPPLPAPAGPLTQSTIVQLYAVKHNPFAYFKSVQEGQDPDLSLARTVGFDGPQGLYVDLGSGTAPNFSFIVPNQCNDQHGRGNDTAVCAYDPNDNGTQAGLNPALLRRGDATVKKIVESIHNAPLWKHGRNAIVVVWDENDYAVVPNIVNKVLLIVDTNYGVSHVESGRYYMHFSLLKTLEAGFRLPCLNHACDASVDVISDLFAPGSGHDHDGDDH